MKFYSDVTKKLYDSAEQCAQEEKHQQQLLEEKALEEKKKSEERAVRAKEVEDAYKAVNEAQSKYNQLLKDFVSDYGHFHMSITEPLKHETILDAFDRFFNLL